MQNITYDRFQQEAINHINQGESVIVSAPTGAGKTAIAEHVIISCIEKKVGVIYTSPIKALSNQKFRDFQNLFGDSVGILTGDVSLNASAPVLIMTTEIFRNKVLDEPESLERYSWIIFDEIHYIDNPERGTVWEESLIFLPKHMRILGLSATIPNIEQLAEWIQSIHQKPIKIVIEEKRPVPLHFFFQAQNQIFENIHHMRKIRIPAHRGYHDRSKEKAGNKVSSLISAIEQKEGFPCIYFVFGRKRAEALAHELANFNFLNKTESNAILNMYDDLLKRYDLTGDKTSSEIAPLIKRGIAYHHAGMLPTLKEVIERLFTSKLLKIIFTTETFALGINMPSRSVIFDELKKFYGHFMRPLKTRDFYQMAGRAGRRSIDTEGFVYCRVNPYRIHFDDVKHIIYSQPEEVRSQLNTSYATILNLYEKYQEDLYKIYPLSLHCFQSRKNQQKGALKMLESKLTLLKETGFIENNLLTQKGLFAKTVYGYELLLAELYAGGILEQLDEFGLGVMAASIVFEPRKNQQMLTISKQSRRLRSTCDEVYEEIKNRERKFKIFSCSKQPYFHLSAAMEAWLQGAEFSKILEFTDTDEGEVVRYFRMSIQILREILDAKVTSKILHEKIKETIKVINRDVVDAEKQLREG